jgi:predicted Zn-dependent protease
VTSMYPIACSLLLLGCVAAPSARPAAPRAATHPATAEALFARGRILARTGDSTRAEEYISLAIRHGYPEEPAIITLVEVCAAASRLQAALQHASPFLRRHPDAWRLRIVVAAIYAALDRPTDAAQELRRVLAQRPLDGSAHYSLGVLKRDAFHDANAARHHFATYLQADGDGRFAREVRSWLEEHPKRHARFSAGASALRKDRGAKP